jgi:hypothetical protein
MSIKKVMVGFCATALVAGFSASVSAETILLQITTKYGKGADAEVRENELNTSGFGDAAVNLGVNRGMSTELATRSTTKTNATTFTPGNTTSSYMKFDISQLPVSSDPYWNGKSVWFRGYTVGTWRAYRNEVDNMQNEVIPLTEFAWKLGALDPNGTYSTAQTDQFGNPYTASQYKYDWTEGTGTGGTDTSGITAFNAPGRKVYCATAGCNTANGNSLGKFDEHYLDPNVLDLGVVPMPVGAPNNLPTRTALTYKDPNGDLSALIKEARDLGLDTITLIGWSGPDGVNFETQPLQFLSGLNQIIAPKDRPTVLGAEPNDNINGAFSPQLLIVPEPATLMLVFIGCIAGLVSRRRCS